MTNKADPQYLSSVHSPERDAIIREHYPTIMPSEQLLALVNAAPPGLRAPMSRETMNRRANKKGWKRPPDYHAGGAHAHVHRTPTFVQKPLAVETIVRLPRDRLPSQSFFKIISDIVSGTTAPCDWLTAIEWGEKWAKSNDLAAINLCRRGYQLPVFEVRAPKYALK